MDTSTQSSIPKDATGLATVVVDDTDNVKSCRTISGNVLAESTDSANCKEFEKNTTKVETEEMDNKQCAHPESKSRGRETSAPSPINAFCLWANEISQGMASSTNKIISNTNDTNNIVAITAPDCKINTQPGKENKARRKINLDTEHQPKKLKTDISEKKIIEIDLTKDEQHNNVPSKADSYKCSDKREDKKKIFENFVSSDPKENDDNNNPDWEVLKKLETDDDRYKAVRKRWRNLIIPDPNKNLTCIHVKATFKHPNFFHVDSKETQDSTKISRKRTSSYEPTSSTSYTHVKRARTRSCTTSYDLKVEEHYKKMREEEKKLLDQRTTALASTSIFYSNQQLNLLASNLKHRNSWEYQAKLAHLRAQQREAEAAVHRDFTGAMDRLDGERHGKAIMFKKAMKEVEAFHKFYRKLDESSKKEDCFFLTDVELDDVFQTDELYERFEKFYS